MDVKNLVKHAPGIQKFVYTLGNTYADALCAAVNLIREDKKKRGGKHNLTRRYILFVPDKYTLLAEKLLYEDNACAFDCEALTVNRLCYRLAERTGEQAKPLSRTGAILAVRRIISENPEELGYFKRSARFPGFGETMYENIAQLSACGVMPEDLDCGGGETLARKLSVLKYIYSRFRNATEGKFVDASGRLRLTYELLEQNRDFFDDTFVVFACYDGFTPLTARIVNKVCEICGENNAYIADAEIKLDISGKKICEYEAVSAADELKAAARSIRNLALKGEKYDDMGVIAVGVDHNRLKRIFDEYGVPYFADEKYALSSHPLARYILDLFAAVCRGTNSDYIRLAKNPYSGVKLADADAFENTVYALSMKEWSMNSAFDCSAVRDARLREKLDAAEKVRAALVSRVYAVRKANVSSGEDFVRAVERAVPQDEAEISAKYCGNFPSAREEITSAVEVIGTVFGRAKFETMYEALRECFSLKEVGVIPNRSNAVEVGDVSVFRASKKKYLFVLGMHDGELPAAAKDEGFISDADIAALGTENVHIEPSIETLNLRAEAELDSVLASSENLFLSYSADCAPSPALLKVRRLAQSCGAQIKAQSFAFLRETLNEKSLYSLCPTRDAALELYLAGMDDINAGGGGYGFEPELYEAVKDRLPQRIAATDSVAGAKKLYPRSDISISRVQEYFACPFRHFMRYGIKAKERPSGNVTPLDLGTFLHRVIELFIAGKDYSEPETAVKKIVQTIAVREPELVRGISDDFLTELTEEAIKLSSVAADQISRGAFTPEYTEASFGKKDSPLKGLEICVNGKTLTVEGIIDRMDVADAGEGSRGIARVIDYKTGKADFDLRDVYFGRKIQLPVYLKVARANGYIPSGMFYFPFSSGFTEDEKSYRLRGIFDSAYARETDSGLCSPEYDSTVVSAKSAKNSSCDAPALYKRGGAVSGDTLAFVCDYAERALTAGASEMLSGYCAPSPLSSGRSSECDYCEMKPVCAARGMAKRKRIKSAVKAEIFAVALGESDK